MKLLFSRQNLVFALSAGLLLAACGGGKATFDVKGEVQGVRYTGLVLTNTKNADSATVAVAATSFKLPKSIEYGEEYEVVVTTQPLHQNCQIFNGKDTAGRLATINIGVSCVLNERSLGGKITGLTSDGLVLTNGSDEQLAVLKGATTFTFGRQLPFDTAYGVTILKQPASNLCTLSNGVGKMGDTAIDTIVISCL